MKEYFEKEALNFSTLQALDTNYPGNVFEIREDTKITPAMSRGSLVDCLLTSPQEFNQLFIIVDIPELSPAIKNVIDYLLIKGEDYSEKAMLEASLILGFGGKSWSDTTKINKLKTDETEEYYNKKKELIGKEQIQITTEEYEKASTVIDTLKNHPFSHWIFNPEEGVEIKFQHPIYWNKLDVPCKALLDIIVIDHNKKIIYPIDLKTKSDSQFGFKSSFMRFKYYLQAGWYTEAVERSLLEEFKDYKVSNFMFLVTSFEYPTPPLLFKCSDELMEVAKNGGYYKGERIKGTNDLFNDYIWYYEQDRVDYSRDLYQNNGVIEMDFLKTTL